ncbi:signal peptide peptidase SppA [Patescibacteria group bacterium]|nr:signal peptide peptidase SppA [Patescibacteria group bacterium]
MNGVWIKRIVVILFVLGLLATTAVSAFVAGLASGIFSKAEKVTLSEEVIAGEEEQDKIGILRLEGLIVSSGPGTPIPTGQGLITANQVKRWMREIARDGNLKALVIEINSPGGSPVASDEIYKAITTLRRTGRSVVVVMEDMGTSGAYFIASAADTIIANPATLTGSIGVLAEITNAQELLAKLGIDIEIYKSGKYKDLSSFARGRTEEEKAIIQEYVDTAFDLFITRVAEGRGMEKERVRALAEGQIYSGKKAKELGLIDKLGSVEDGVAEAKSLQGLTDVKIVRYRTESPLDVLLGRVAVMLDPLSPLMRYLSAPGIRVSYLPSF